MREKQLADEVEAYLAAASGNPIPDKEDAGSEIPEALEWLLRLDRWRRILGDLPLVEGGLLDQPYHFMEDLACADAARALYRQFQEANARAQVVGPVPVPDDVPVTMEPMTIDLMKELGVT